MTHEEAQELAALHAIGAASAEESAELRRHLASCDECRHAADELDEAAALTALSLDPVAPPPLVRANVMRAIAPPAPARPASPWLRIAAAILVVFLGASVVQWLTARRAAERLTAENAALRAENEKLSALRAEKEKLSETIAALSAAGTRTIQLAGQEAAPSASARAFLDPAQRRAFVFFHGLPPATTEKEYQLWVIRADQVAPQSAGVFRVDAQGNASLVVSNLPVDVEIKALAVTLEAAGGVPAPTGKILLMGG